MAMLNPIEHFVSISNQIKDLEKQRKEVLSDLLIIVKQTITKKMDWAKEDVNINSFDYDLISECPKIDVCWNKDLNARYVFTVLLKAPDTVVVRLDFREDFSKY